MTIIQVTCLLSTILTCGMLANGKWMFGGLQSYLHFLYSNTNHRENQIFLSSSKYNIKKNVGEKEYHIGNLL